ncbi:MAG: RHS repeat domain-containing protein [Elusimicrobiales bacterium]
MIWESSTGPSTKFAYGNGACPSCGGSQLSALTDPKGNTWSFNYDQYGRLTDTSNPLGQKKNYQYDKMSRVTGVKDPAGNITAFTYDALNRLTRRDIQSPAGGRSITDYTYDAVGNLLSASNGASSVSFVYDALNRVVETDQAFGGKFYTIGYAYDAAGNRVAMATPWGRYSYTYDALNRVTGIVNPQGITIAFGYDAVGRRTKKSVFKSVPELLAETAYTYDAAGQLLSILNKAGGKVVDFANYEYDAAGNRIKKEDLDGTTKYRYDASNRLITAEPVPMNMPEAEVFIYDRNGNRRYDRGAWDYKYDAANRLLENSTYTYTHDHNGNLIGRAKKDDDSAISYAYTPEQQLSEVVTPRAQSSIQIRPLRPPHREGCGRHRSALCLRQRGHNSHPRRQ